MTASGNNYKSGLDLNEINQTHGFMMEHDEQPNFAEEEGAPKRRGRKPNGKSEQQDDKQLYLQKQVENTNLDKN